MAFYSIRRDSTVVAQTQFVTPGGDPSTFRTVQSVRRVEEVITAVDSVSFGTGIFRSGSDTLTAVDTLGATGQPLIGEARRSDEVITAVDTVAKVYDAHRRKSEALTAVDTTRRFLNFFREGADTVTAADSLPEAILGKWYWRNETVTAVDTLATALEFKPESNEVVTAVDEVRVSLRPRPGVGLVLLPFRNGTDQDFSLFPDAGEEAYENVNDIIPDETSTYVFNASTPGEAVTFLIDPPLLPVASPHRITGIWLLLRVQGAGATFKPRFRLHGRLFDSPDELSPAGASWQSFYTWWPHSVFGQRPWTSSDLLDLEVGLVNTGSIGISLTQVTVWVATEPTPLRTVNLNSQGRYQDWTPKPAEGSPTVGLSLDDGDRTYVQSEVVGDKQTVRSFENVFIPPQFQIDKVQMDIRARGDGGYITPLIWEEGIDHPGPFAQGEWLIPVDDDLDTLQNSGTWRSWQVPLYSRPHFTSGMARWSLPDVQAAEWGVENYSAETVQVSHVGLSIWASLIPESELRLLPTSNGYYQDWNIQSPNAGEAAYEDINSFNIDDNNYLRADATVTPKLVTFQVTSTAEENWYGVRWRARMRKEPGSPASRVRAAPLLRKNGILHVGRPFEFTQFSSAAFVELVEDYWCNPFDGKPWTSTALQTIEVGVLLLEGRADLSWCVLEAGTVPPREHGNDTWQLEFTDTGEANVARAVSDSLIWTVDRFEVGRGGFQRDNPAVVHPVERSDDTLEDPLFTGKVLKSAFDGWTAYYWLAFPPGHFSDPIGELRLMARVVSSNNLSDVVGSYFPMATAHFPAGFHTLRTIRVIRVALQFNS